MNRVLAFCLARPRLVAAAMGLSTLALVLLAALPSLWPQAFGALHGLRVDTDPENMLPADEPVRVFHARMKRQLALAEVIVLGVVNEAHPEGVFNPASLRKIYELTAYAKTLRWPDAKRPERQEGVIAVDLLAPSTVDHLEPAGAGDGALRVADARAPSHRGRGSGGAPQAGPQSSVAGNAAFRRRQSPCPLPAHYLQGCQLPRGPQAARENHHLRRTRAFLHHRPAGGRRHLWRRDVQANGHFGAAGHAGRFCAHACLFPPAGPHPGADGRGVGSGAQHHGAAGGYGAYRAHHELDDPHFPHAHLGARWHPHPF
ncbi:MAG: hypothetical protein KatS3mg131_1406 [Candidatus Tectimicrobiota bacterium]|nr:MAG: hypothetical protein KatS3mg131_1406 [Candidatus Tectomicrobia bacterium]